MGITIETPVEAQWPDIYKADARSFGYVPEPGGPERARSVIDLSRFRVAIDDGQIVGVAGSFALDVTLPGGTTVPMSGITWVSVAATHRRRGILTRLMDACHADTDDRGEPVAMLFASEASIYERFGYGIATELRGARVDRSAARFRPTLAPERHAVRYVEGDDAHAHREKIWQQYHRLRAGEVMRSPAWQQFLTEIWALPKDGAGPAFQLAHRDGYAVYRVADKWGDNGPAYRLDVLEVAALNDQAHLDLWHALLGVDLVATVSPRFLAMDDPLPYYFTDRRAVRTTSLRDGLWVNVRDVATCFGSRVYGSTDKIVVEVAGKRWAIESDGVEASCRAVRTRPDLVVDQPSLGVLLLGAIRPSQLMAAGRIETRSADVARRADAFFVSTPMAHCQTFF